MGNKVIIHHNDMDGLVAAWCLWLHGWKDAELIPARYKEEAPDVSGKEVAIVDFSYPRETLLAMESQAKALLVLDHHETAQADLEGLDFCTFDMAKSGARLAWEYIHKFTSAPPPEIVLYVEDRDLWKFELPKSREINAWLRFKNPQTMEDVSFLATYLSMKMSWAIGYGETILNTEQRLVEAMAKNATSIVVLGVDLVVVNCTCLGSEVGNYLVEKYETPAACWRRRADGKAHWELRSKDHLLDVSIVAKKMGGGGHRNAAGFIVDWEDSNVLLSYCRSSTED